MAIRIEKFELYRVDKIHAEALCPCWISSQLYAFQVANPTGDT